MVVSVDNEMNVGKNRQYITNRILAEHIPRPSSGPMTKGPLITFAIDGITS